MHVLVTGVSGFVGSAIGRFLRIEHGMQVTGISRTPPREAATDSFLAHDLSRQLPPGLGPFDAIVHAAALASPFARRDAYEAANVTATRNIVDLAAASPATHLVFISSSSVFYRPGDQFGITEVTPFAAPAINSYAASKQQAEAIVRSAPGPFTILRPRAVFGTGDTVLLPRILRAARLGLLPSFSRSDGLKAEGDVVSIDNLVRTIAEVLSRKVTGDFNLTDGKPVVIDRFVADVLARLGLPAPRFSVPARLASAVGGALEWTSAHLLGWREPPLTRYGVAVFSQSKTFDIAKAVHAFGPPSVTTEEALERFVAWYRAGAQP